MVTLILCFFSCEKHVVGEFKDSQIKEINKNSATQELHFKNECGDVSKTITDFYNAMISPNYDKLNSICSEKLVFGHSNGIIHNKEYLINGLIDGHYNYLSIDYPNQSISILGNIAIVRSDFIAEAMRENNQVNIKAQTIKIFEYLEDKSWQLVARQVYNAQ